MSQAIYRVYRPSTFADLIGQSHVAMTIQNQYAAGTLAHAYLFTGPRGVGKTTTARLIAKLVNCEHVREGEPCNACSACQQISAGTALDVFEIDAASNTDVEHVRENIIKSVRFAPAQLKKKVYIIDEVHMLSTSAFNALLKTLEEPPDHVLFVLATTELHKVPATIVSRCQRFDFRRIPASEMIARLERIGKQEGVHVEKEVLEQIVRQSDGCARDAETLFGQILALGDKEITMAEASLVLPVSTQVFVETLLGHLFARDARAAVDALNTFLEQGLDLKAFLDDVLSALREQLFTDQTGFVAEAITALLEARTKIRAEHLPQLPVELAIVKLCQGGSGVRALAPDLPSSPVIPPDVAPPVASFVSESVPVQVPKELSEAATEQVFGSIPVLSIVDVQQKWPQVYEQIKECNASLPLMIQSCEIAGVDGDLVELGFGFDLYVDTVNKDKNRRVIEEVLERVLGTRVKVRAVSKKGVGDEVVADLIGQFGGTERSAV